MSDSAYSLCPGGTGKKVKFCCPDLVGDLDKIQRMMEAEQRAACLDHIERLEAKHPDRACLMSYKAMIQTQLGEKDRATETLAKYQQLYPQNPVALAEAAMVKLDSDPPDLAGAISLLQDALEVPSEQVHRAVVETAMGIGMIAMRMGELPAARAHLGLVAQYAEESTLDQIESLLVQATHAVQLPLALRGWFTPQNEPAEGPWLKQYEVAIHEINHQHWRKAAAILEALTSTAPTAPDVWNMLAVVRGWLADHEGAIAALRKYAQLDIPHDDKVEAEALAQALTGLRDQPLDELTVEVYDVSDTDSLLAKLAASQQTVTAQVPQMGSESEPPPKAAFMLLDRPKNNDPATLADACRVCGRALVFGKQTDRPARLELIILDPQQQATAQKVMREVGGDVVGGLSTTRPLGKVPTLERIFEPNLWLPPTFEFAKMKSFRDQENRHSLLEVWTTIPWFSGKNARDAAQDPQLRIAVEAAILLLESRPEHLVRPADLADLRSSLGLPQPEPIRNPADLQQVPILRISRIEPTTLSDDDLIRLLGICQAFVLRDLQRPTAEEMLKRPQIEESGAAKADLYALLAMTSEEPAEVFANFEKARQEAKAKGKSCARYDLEEFELRLLSGATEGLEPLLEHITAAHMREPGVRERIMQLLMAAGLIGPDGQLRATPRGAEPSLAMPGAAASASEPSGIWTPGSETSGGGKKSSLWIPE